MAAVRLLTLTGARLSEILNLKWDEIGDLGENGANARIEDSKTGPRTIWLGLEAARLLTALPWPQGGERVFTENLTSARLYTFWVRIRDETGLAGLRIHDCQHPWASQDAMNGVGLTTVGRLLGHRQRETAAIYAHLDDGALKDAAGQLAVVIARAIEYKVEPPPGPDDAEHRDELAAMPEFSNPERPPAPKGARTPLWLKSRELMRSDVTESEGDAGRFPDSRPWTGCNRDRGVEFRLAALELQCNDPATPCESFQHLALLDVKVHRHTARWCILT